MPTATSTAASQSKLPKLLRMADWVGETFGPLIAFVVLEHTVSLFAAIVSSIVTGALLVLLQIARDRKISPFTAFIAVSVAVFGTLDLHYQTGFFVKIEPALGNTVTGSFFIGSVAVGRPIIIELAEKQLGRALPERAHGYLRALTVAWGLFFFLRAAVYVWMAYNLSIDQALAIRAVAGPVSIGVMIFGEMGLRYLRFGAKALRRGPAEGETATDGESPRPT